MTFDTIESSAFTKASFQVSDHLSKLHTGFDSKVSAVSGVYENFSSALDDNVAKWLGEEVRNVKPSTVCDKVKQMYSGTKLSDGKSTLGLKEINNRKIDPNNYYRSIKQHAGFSAEVISTAKENLKAELDNTGIRTYRADDRPDLFAKNDQYVDKFREDQNGKIIERIQTKFVGKDPADCFKKLQSSKYDKYIYDGMVDKLEIPKDYYEGVKNCIADKRESLNKQLETVTAKNDPEAMKSIQRQIDRNTKLDGMLEQSTVTSDEAVYATEHPERYACKRLVENIAKAGHTEGIKAGAAAAGLTAAVSIVDNVQKTMNGEISPEAAAANVAKDTAIAGAMGYGTTFVSTAVSQAMSASSHTLIKALGNSGLPAATITFAVSSYDSIIDYAQGTIDEAELALDLSKNAVNIAGGALGSAAAGAVLGSVVPGAGTVVGFTVGLVGGIVGTAVASEMYSTALEYGPEVAQGFADKAQEMASQAVETVQQYASEKVDGIKSALNTFIKENNLPFTV